VRRAIGEIFESNHRCYGYRRMRASLNRQHVSISEKVVQRLTKQERPVVADPVYIRRYNESRIKISLGYLSPVEYRRSLGMSA